MKIYDVNEDFYGIDLKEDGCMTLYRKRVVKATDNPMTPDEDIILGLAERVLSLEKLVAKTALTMGHPQRESQRKELLDDIGMTLAEAEEMINGR